MRRTTFIAFVVLGLVAVSCTKETIRPNASTGQELPQWRGASSVETGTESSSPEDDGSITDPNNDEDNNRRKKQ